MEDFYYNFIKDKFADKAEMLLTDNDSLMYKIEVEIFSEDFYKNKELFDLFVYPKDSKFCNNTNNLVVNKMEDETCDMSIRDFVGSKSKM